MTTTPPEPSRTRWARDLIVGVLFIGLGTYTVVTGNQFKADLREQQDCISGYITTNSETSIIRAGLVKRSERSFESLIFDVSGATTSTQFRRAFRTFKVRRDAIAAARARHPFKVFDEARCGAILRQQEAAK